MGTKYTTPLIPECNDVNELRNALSHSLGVLVAQLNNEKVTSEFDANDYRIINVARPAAMHDAVNVEFIRDLLGKMAIPKRQEGGAGGVYEMHWGLGVGGAPVAQNYVAPPRIVAHACQPVKAYISCQVAPTGADLIVDIVNQNDVSMFGGTKLTLPAGTTARTVVSYTNIFASPVPTYNEGDSLSLNITQVGSSVKGSKIAVLIDMKVL